MKNTPTKDVHGDIYKSVAQLALLATITMEAWQACRMLRAPHGRCRVGTGETCALRGNVASADEAFGSSGSSQRQRKQGQAHRTHG